MTVSEMMELLSKMDPNSVVCIYDGEYETNNPVNEVVELKIPNETIVVLY